jgi:hypothetical protein
MGCRNGIKQVFTPYYKWECYKSGMWFKVNKSKEIEMLRTAVEFTGNHILYGKAMREVVYLWENSMVNFLTNKNINRRAYLGHCAVCYKLKIPEYIVRSAWKSLSNNQRILADKVAEETIKEWEIWYTTKLTNTLRNGKKNATKKAYQTKLL